MRENMRTCAFAFLKLCHDPSLRSRRNPRKDLRRDSGGTENRSSSCAYIYRMVEVPSKSAALPLQRAATEWRCC